MVDGSQSVSLSAGSLATSLWSWVWSWVWMSLLLLLLRRRWWSWSWLWVVTVMVRPARHMYLRTFVPNGAWSLSRCVAFRHDVRMSQSGLGGCWPDRFPLIPHHGRAHARAQIHPHAHAHAHAPTPTPTPSPSPSPSLGWPPSRARPARMCGAVGLGCWRTWTLAWVTSVAPRVVIAPRRDG